MDVVSDSQDTPDAAGGLTHLRQDDLTHLRPDGSAQMVAVSGKAVTARDVDAYAIQAGMRAQGADPGDQPASNATFPEMSEV